jgi:hypothetical protein
MKIHRLETHDRYQYFTKQNFSISECCQNIIDQRPFEDHNFYIFAHARTHEDGVTKRLIWQPRLTKPKAQTNSMLFKAYPGTDNINIIWIIPQPELWGQYKKGNICGNQIIIESIDAFKYRRYELEKKEKDDLSDLEIEAIYKEIAKNAKYKAV